MCLYHVKGGSSYSTMCLRAVCIEQGFSPLYPNLSDGQKCNDEISRLMCSYIAGLDRLSADDKQWWSASYPLETACRRETFASKLGVVIGQYIFWNTIQENAVFMEYSRKMGRCSWWKPYG